MSTGSSVPVNRAAPDNTFYQRLLTNIRFWMFHSSYNRPGNAVTVAVNTTLCLSIIIAAFGALTVRKVPLSIFDFFPYFFAGVLAAFLTEVYFYFVYGKFHHQFLSQRVSDDEGSNLSDNHNDATDNGLVTEAAVDNRTGYQPMATTGTSRRDGHELMVTVLAYLWRFLPDMLAFLMVMCLTTAGLLAYRPFQRTLQWTIVPIISILYLMVVTIQDDWSRHNLTRWFLETRRVMNWFGYISYPMFLFQKSLLNWWAPKITECINSKKFALFIGHNPAFGNNPSDATWFTNLNFGWRILGFFLLSVFCWLVQKYFQDTYILWLYRTILGWKCERSYSFFYGRRLSQVAT